MNPVLVTHREVIGPEHNRTVVCNAHLVWCPGCDSLHRFRSHIDGGTNTGPLWDWDGNAERPTFTPSLLVRWNGKENGQSVSRTCHSFLREGVWQFLPDCTHDLASRQVAMVPLPDWVVAE